MVGSTYIPTTVNANDNTCNIYYNTAVGSLMASFGKNNYGFFGFSGLGSLVGG
jgi:hypothetical protein